MNISNRGVVTSFLPHQSQRTVPIPLVERWCPMLEEPTHITGARIERPSPITQLKLSGAANAPHN